MIQAPPEQRYTLDRVPCPKCGAILDAVDIEETLDYWNSVGDVRCGKCGADCHVETVTTRRASAELAPKPQPEAEPQPPSEATTEKPEWYVQTADSQLRIVADTAREAATKAVIRLYNAGEALGQLLSVSKHGYDSESGEDVFFSVERIVQTLAQDPPARKLSDQTKQDLVAFPHRVIAGWEHIYRDPNGQHALAYLYHEAKALAEATKA